MRIEEELERIICEQIGVDEKEFGISYFLGESWMTEDDLFRAIKTLLIRRRKRIKK